MTWTKRQNEIIDATLKLTAAGGIQNLTVKRISEEVGVTEPALYRHFKNKSEIIKAMIGRFDNDVIIQKNETSDGLATIKQFITNRIEQVCLHPDLAKVMFAEEMFMDDLEFQELMLQMIHRHKKLLIQHFQIGQEEGEIRSDIALDILFRLVFGPVRLLIKQWGMTNHAFDLPRKGNELIEAIVKILTPMNSNSMKSTTPRI